MKKESCFIAIFMFLAIVATRMMPHPLNFTALIAVSLFSGSYWRKPLNVVVPILAMLFVDIQQGIYPGMLFTYAGVIVSVRLAPSLQASAWSIGGRGLAAALAFFVLSNFGVWLQAGIYTQDMNGFIECYVRAIPFFRNILLSTWFYSFVFYGAYRTVFAPMGLEGFFKLGYGRQK